MEVQSPPQSVQINFNNKIITLHNVKIVKNPKIITIDATQYSNFLKGSPVKLSNGTTTSATPVKLQMPTLLPSKTVVASPLSNAFKAGSIILNRTPVITKISTPTTNQFVQSFQQNKNFVQFKSSINIVPAAAALSKSPVKLQALPISRQPSVIISPPKASPGVFSPVKSQPKPEVQQPLTIPRSVTQNVVSLSMSIIKAETTPPKAIVSQSQKNKTSPCTITPPAAKRQRKKIEFTCIFCEDIFDDSNMLVEHMKLKHPEKVKIPKEESGEKKKVVHFEKHPKIEESAKPFAPVRKEIPLKKVEPESDDDEGEVRDLIMDLDDTQDTALSAQTRSDTPESPEFEEHFPDTPATVDCKEGPQEESESCSEDFDYENYEHFSRMLEPICELNCEDDSNDGAQDENEAMRLYREAMEVNYQQNGIKKRGRRKQRKPKPLVENTTSLNGILAGLLENSCVKVPPGPGRGRRKEINEQELELDRSNGVCLFSCNKCDETFKYAGDLAKHVRSHTISSPYQCSICQRKFTHIGSLNTHLRIHSGERPYKVRI